MDREAPSLAHAARRLQLRHRRCQGPSLPRPEQTVSLQNYGLSGYMDNVRLKDAIYRAKGRRSALYRQHKARSEEKSKRQKLASTTGAEKLNPTAQVLTGRKKASIV
ncbi:hypothetical protein ZIOFF_024724 [Zingiber officinale]|uniref:Uncharacterized protein n=1 Tax=Zingiber officinale TaxID=94328 RepID=A0A8J5H0S4_ZINOF|nr:hypothetical protein ZIOFF_024724 [Zingiber officinale]